MKKVNKVKRKTLEKLEFSANVVGRNCCFFRFPKFPAQIKISFYVFGNDLNS